MCGKTPAVPNARSGRERAVEHCTGVPPIPRQTVLRVFPQPDLPLLPVFYFRPEKQPGHFLDTQVNAGGEEALVLFPVLTLRGGVSLRPGPGYHVEGLPEHIAGLRPDRLGEVEDHHGGPAAASERIQGSDCFSFSAEGEKALSSPTVSLEPWGALLRAPVSELPPKETLSWQCPRPSEGKDDGSPLLLLGVMTDVSPCFSLCLLQHGIPRMHERDPLHSLGLSSSPALLIASSLKPWPLPATLQWVSLAGQGPG